MERWPVALYGIIRVPFATLLGHSGWVCAVAWRSDGVLASGSWDKTIKLWRDEKCIGTLKGHTGCVCAVAWGSDGVLATSSNDLTIKLWRDDGTCIATQKARSGIA